MGSTRINAYPYPEGTDQTLVPSHLEALARAIAYGSVMRFASAADRTAAFTTLGVSPSQGMVSYLIDTDRYYKASSTGTWLPLSHPPQAATVATLQTGAGTGYSDLATVGPAVSLETGSVAVVSLACGLFNSGSLQTFMGVGVSGATTVAASDARSLSAQNANLQKFGVTFTITGLTPGVNVFTAKYRVVGGTGSWQDRDITVQPSS